MLELKSERGQVSPLSCSFIANIMIKKEDLVAVVQNFLSETNVFLVDVKIGTDNRIVVELDSDEPITIDFCAKTTRQIESEFDREVEDYELEVGSAGLSAPFKIVRQYRKNLGNEVEILTKDGKKLFATIIEVEDDYFVVEQESMQKQEGVKRKVSVVERIKFLYSEVKYTKYLIRFK